MAGDQYSSWMSNALSSDDTTPIPMPDGTFFTPVQAGNDPAKTAAAMSVLRRQYIAERGIENLNPALLNEHMFPKMYKADATILQEARKQNSISRSLDITAEAENQLRETGDVQTFLNTVSTTVDKNGDMRGRVGAWEYLEQLNKDAAQARQPLQLDQLASQMSDNGQTFGERWKRRFDRMRNDQEDILMANSDEDWKERTQMVRGYQTEFEQLARQKAETGEAFSNADIAELKEQWMAQSGLGAGNFGHSLRTMSPLLRETSKSKPMTSMHSVLPVAT